MGKLHDPDSEQIEEPEQEPGQQVQEGYERRLNPGLEPDLGYRRVATAVRESRSDRSWG